MTTVTVSKKALDALIKLARYHELDSRDYDSYQDLRQAFIDIGQEPFEYRSDFMDKTIAEAIKAANYIEYLS